MLPVVLVIRLALLISGRSLPKLTLLLILVTLAVFRRMTRARRLARISLPGLTFRGQVPLPLLKLLSAPLTSRPLLERRSTFLRGPKRRNLILILLSLLIVSRGPIQFLMNSGRRPLAPQRVAWSRWSGRWRVILPNLLTVRWRSFLLRRSSRRSKVKPVKIRGQRHIGTGLIILPLPSLLSRC